MADRIAIVGLGLIGSSIGLALKKAAVANIEIVGHDKDPEVSGKAKKRGAVDKAEWNLLTTVENASLVIIATPVLSVKTVMEQISEHLREGAVVSDTASTKAQVLQWAKEILPSHVNFVGGHPMAGKEFPGVDAAEATLFNDATYCICPSPMADESAVRLVESLVLTIGAKPYFVDPYEHDGLVAAISHLPIVVSAALVSTTTGSPSWREMRKVASTGFRDLTRLASGDATMNLDICLTNKEEVIRWIDRYVVELQRYRGLIGGGGEPLAREFLTVQMERDRWVNGKGDDDRREDDVRSVSLSQMLLGDRLGKISGYMNQDDKKKR